jgi:hypothetical protein
VFVLLAAVATVTSVPAPPSVALTLSLTTLAAPVSVTYLLFNSPKQGDSLWPAFAGTGTGQGLLCRRRSHPSRPTRDPGLSTALLSRSTLEPLFTAPLCW